MIQTLQIRKQILIALNLQYRTSKFKNQQNFHQLLHNCIIAINEGILMAKYAITCTDINKYAIKSHHSNLQSPFEEDQEHFMHQLVSTCQLVITQPQYRNLNTLNQFILDKKLGHLKLKQYYRDMGIFFRYLSIKEAMIYLALSQCKIWYIVCKNRKKSTKQFDLDPLINLFKQIVARLNLQNPYHKNILTRKAVKNIEKKQYKQKSNNPLFDAVSNSDYGLVKQLLLKGANLQKPSYVNRSHQIQMRCTHRACMKNDIQMCRILNSFGADWQAQDSEKMTPIFYAVQAGSLQIIKYLNEEIKVDIQKKQIQNRTSFYFACTQNGTDVIDYLYKAGCDINMKSELGRTALSKACYLGRVDIVKYLLSCKDIDMYAKCKKGRTALHNAIFGPKGGREGQKFGTNDKDSPECAQILLQQGMDVDTLDFQKCTPLHVAMSSEALDSIRVLLAFGASLSARNNYGQTPLMTAAKFGHVDAVKIVVEEFDDDITVKDVFNKNVLLLTAKFKQNGQYGINPVYTLLLEPFIKQCKNINKIDQIHYTFKQLLINQSPIQLEALWKKCEQHQIPLPEFETPQIQKLLNLSINRRAIIQSNLKYLHKNQQKQAFRLQAAKQSNIASQILQKIKIPKEIVEEICQWMIMNNDGKLLQHTQQSELISLNDIQIPPQKLMMIIENDSYQLKQKVITFCLISLNFDWLKYRNERKENILHILTRKQKAGSMVQVFKALAGKIPEKICSNKYLKCLQNQQERKITLQYLLQQKNQSDINPLQLSLILKNNSIAKLIDEKMKEQNLQASQTLDIQQYKPILENDPQQLKTFNQKNHQKQEMLEEFEYMIQQMVNQKIQDQWKNIFGKLTQFTQQSLQKQFETRKLIYINDSNLLERLQQLNKQEVVGIDLEYFNNEGITIVSTLQLSSVSTDYIVDCLKNPLKVIRQYLTPLFHSDKILKIMHGADNDLILIRSHFNLCLINFVDTSRLDIELRHGKNDLRGLATLCKQYMGINLSKQYQVSEWRLRPLPKAMLQYARKDSMILPFLLSKMFKKTEKESLKNLIIGGCRQVRRNKKQTQPLIKQIWSKFISK